MKKQVCIYIYGPTAVGKTDMVDALAQLMPIEVINLDMGQLYTPLTIGTAKPNWRHASVPHHLFDKVPDPVDVTVVQYRAWLVQVCHEIWQAGKIPVAVGGSAFYLRSIFFPPTSSSLQKEFVWDETEVSWELLNHIDPNRARAISPSDTYRIRRALEIWYTTGRLPSEQVPQYDPPSDYIVVCLTRDRDDLYRRINERVGIMMQHGWLDEVRTIMDTPWKPWLLSKKIIGYDDIIRHLDTHQGLGPYEALIQTIAQRTRNYAKRQMSFWRMLERQLVHALGDEQTSREHWGEIRVVNLTNVDAQLYSVQIKNEITSILARE